MIFIHENNIKNKIAQNYKKVGNKIEKFYYEEYIPVKQSLLDINFTNETASFGKATEIINKYLQRLSEFSKEYNIDAHSKFRSTFLEEISVYLFKDNEFIKSNELGIYNKGIYAGMKVDSNMNIRLLKKDVDFCIGKNCNIEIDRKSNENIIVPIVAVEVKTYLDGTMLGEVQYSSKLIKNATPNAKTYVLMETNEVGEDKIMAARYDNVINEMFVLRENKHKSIDKDVLLDYYKEIESAIKKTDSQSKINVPGRLINVEYKKNS